MKFGQLIRALWDSTPGKLGLVLLVTLSVASILVVILYPSDFGPAQWGNPALWADNPKAVPPTWVAFGSRIEPVPHRSMVVTEPTRTRASGRIFEQFFEIELDYDAGEAPTFLSLAISDVEYRRRPPFIVFSMIRPDGSMLVLHREAISGPRRSEEAPYSRHKQVPLRVVVGADDQTIDAIADVYADSYESSVSRELLSDFPLRALFGKPKGNDLEPLMGDYRFEVRIVANHPEDRIGSARVVVGGSVFGLMGTDGLGRDLAVGLLFGLPVALLIGISTSTISTLLGMTLGMSSGFFGGRTDIVIQRAADIVANVPVLPLLIFLVFIGGSHLWLILLVLVAFSWPGLTIMVRSMVLQIRTGQEVEATQALGASGARIIFRHILPHTASYALAQLVFFAPSAILAEAGLSFLGLGDPTIPTWGQILEDGFRTGAVFLGYWWWVIPPGILIVITALTFMFLALGLEPVVDPRLRGRRSWHY